MSRHSSPLLAALALASCATTRAVPFPERERDAPAGRALMAAVADLPLTERETRLVAAIAAGNVPPHLRRPRTISYAATDANGALHRVEVDVLPDVLAVGRADDFVRVPLTPGAAADVARRFGYVLPTTRIVDEVHAAADVRLEPIPLTEARTAVATFVDHDDRIAAALGPDRIGRLVSGIKKDVVLTPRLAGRADRVAIYGWHRPDGTPIQPLYVGHSSGYVDYSHGVRLVLRTARVDGEDVDLAELLADPARCALVSDEGPIQATR